MGQNYFCQGTTVFCLCQWNYSLFSKKGEEKDEDAVIPGRRMQVCFCERQQCRQYCFGKPGGIPGCLLCANLRRTFRDRLFLCWLSTITQRVRVKRVFFWFAPLEIINESGIKRMIATAEFRSERRFAQQVV